MKKRGIGKDPRPYARLRRTTFRLQEPRRFEELFVWTLADETIRYPSKRHGFFRGGGQCRTLADKPETVLGSLCPGRNPGAVVCQNAAIHFWNIFWFCWRSRSASCLTWSRSGFADPESDLVQPIRGNAKRQATTAPKATRRTEKDFIAQHLSE